MRKVSFIFTLFFLLSFSCPLASGQTMGERNALRSAGNYLNIAGVSHSGLMQQLEFDGYTLEEAKYAADNCGADWNEQAARKAKMYLEITGFSRSGLIQQLVSEGFTLEQAEYAVKEAGY